MLLAEIGGRHVAVTGALDGSRADRTIRASRSGELPVTLVLLNAEGDTIASTHYTQLFENGSTHWVAVSLGTRRPVGHCIGELLVLATNSPPDTAFVMYGSLPNGAIC